MSTHLGMIGEWSLTRYAGPDNHDGKSRIRFQLTHSKSGQYVSDLTNEDLLSLLQLMQQNA